MTRVPAALLLVLIVLIGGLIVGSQAATVTTAQTPVSGDAHPLIGSWLIYETNPPAGGDPILVGVATFFDDSNALIAFREQRYQGSWTVDSGSEATFTAVAPSAGGIGEIDQLRGSVEVATDGGPFRGIYTYDLLGVDGSAGFTYRGPLEGRRVEVQAPEPYP